jgi:hypothetical protein
MSSPPTSPTFMPATPGSREPTEDVHAKLRALHCDELVQISPPTVLGTFYSWVKSYVRFLWMIWGHVITLGRKCAPLADRGETHLGGGGSRRVHRFVRVDARVCDHEYGAARADAVVLHGILVAWYSAFGVPGICIRCVSIRPLFPTPLV